ncbi:MAG: STAS domain-containing protein [Chitinivibrionales bacterium]|nr:STAS domain-containing protein [Chitinivibrionales bacterium]
MSGSNEFAVETKMGHLWITLPSAIHMDNYREIEQKIESHLYGDSKQIVLDFTNTKRIYSSGMGLLIRLRKQVGEANGNVALVNVSKVCRDLLAEVNLDRLFPVYATDIEFEISQGDVWTEQLDDDDIGFVCIVQIENGICRVNLSGQMSTFKDLSCFEKEMNKQTAGSVVFDLSQLDSIDSYGAHLLANALKEITKKGGKCTAYGANDAVSAILSLLSLEEFLALYATEQEAIEGAKKG